MRADVLVAADAARLVGLRAAAGHRWKSPRGPAEEARLLVDHHLLPLLPLLAAPPRAEERPPAILLRLLVARRRLFGRHPALWAALGSLSDRCAQSFGLECSIYELYPHEMWAGLLLRSSPTGLGGVGESCLEHLSAPLPRPVSKRPAALGGPSRLVLRGARAQHPGCTPRTTIRRVAQHGQTS